MGGRDLYEMEQEVFEYTEDFMPLGGVRSVNLWGPSINLNVAYDENASVATVLFADGSVSFEVTGSSKRNVGEPRDEARGKHLAEARALRNLAAHLESLHPDTP